MEVPVAALFVDNTDGSKPGTADLDEALVTDRAERELAERGGPDAFQEYLRILAVKARDKQKWGAAHSKAARGKLSGHWSTSKETLDESKEILRLLGLPTEYVLDIAADPGSAVAPDWYGSFNLDAKRRDALDPNVSWVPTRPGSAWLNGPYGIIAAFMKRAAGYTGKIPDHPMFVVRDERPRPLMSLTFARTDTQWFHKSVVPAATAVWVREGRISFIDPLTGKKGQVAPAPSLLALYGVSRLDIDLDKVVKVGKWQLVRFAP